MKKLLLLTTIGLFAIANNLFAQANVFDPADPMINYSSSAPAGSLQNPSTNWGNIQKWVVTPRFTWDSAYYKSYHFNGMSFRVMFPKTYQHNVVDGKKYPAMLFFHGAGEKGTIYDNELQLLHGGQLFMNRVNAGQFDGFLVYPQNTGGFFGSSYYGLCMQVLDSLSKYCKLDVDRVFVDGLSAGGQACFDMLIAYPQRVAKTAPSSAASTGALAYIPNFVHIPIWMATGGLDNNPHPLVAQQVYDSIRKGGADIRWTLYPNLGHFVWYNHWQEPDFVPYMNDLHKANPLVYFLHNQFCPDTPVNARLGITAGFYQYEWMKDGVIIPGATANEYVATSYGTYSVHFKRTATSDWSAWSPKPAVISQKATSTTPNIQVSGLRSIVVPAPDSSTTVPLKEPSGYVAYEWYRKSDSVLVGTDSIFNAPPGQYIARIKEQFGCNAFYSPVFTVVNANGGNRPDPAKNLTAYPLSPTSIQLDWSDNPHPAFNETNFEIYRSNSATGGYTLIGKTGTDMLTYVDAGLVPNKIYYYIVRAVNNFSASSNSNQAVGKTQLDNIPPTTPGNLTLAGATRYSAYLYWDSSTDNIAVDKYDIYVNGTKLFSTDHTRFMVGGLDSLKNYNFAVRARDAAGNASPLSNQVTAFTKFQGLIYNYYEGLWNNMPDFTTLAIIKSGTTPTTNISVKNRLYQYGMVWQGYIKIPTSGSYTFSTCSDDGSMLYINQYYDPNATPFINNDGLHGVQCKSASITLNAGVYPITATFFQQGGGDSMALKWAGPGITGTVDIPASAFSDVNTAPGTAPVAPSNLVANTAGFKSINLTWVDNSNNESGFELSRSTAATGPFQTVFTTGPNVTSYVDSGLTASTAYYYRLRAIGTSGESGYTSSFIESNWKVNNTYLDATGNVNRGLNGTNVTFNSTDKKEGTYSLSFPSTAPPGNGYATINNSTGGGFPSDGGYTQRTVALWIKPSSTSGKRMIFDFGGSNNGLALRINANTLEAAVASNSVMGLTTAPFSNTTSWTHVAVVYSGNTIRLFVNGSQVGANTSLAFNSVVAVSGSTSRFGYPSGSANTDNAFNDAQSNFTNYAGLMDDINVINGTLNAADLTAMMNNTFVPSTATTAQLPAPPNAPSNLTANALSSSAITINWNDNSTDESAFEIYRSAGDELHYRLINTLPGSNTATRAFTDESLFANITYYYKVRAIGTGGPSAFTTSANARTLNTKPVMSSIMDFTMRYGTVDTLQVQAADVDGDALTFTTNTLPPFATLTNVSNGIANLIFNPSFGNRGSYVIKFYVSDGNGGVDSTRFTMVVNNNYPPTLQPINNVNMNEGGDTTITLYGADKETPSNIRWHFTGLPSFATFTHDGMGTGTLRLQPGYAASGIYNVSVLIDDGAGGWKQRSFTITVNEVSPNQKILLHMQYHTPAPAPWNNMTTQSVSNLKDTKNVTTTVGAAVANSWQFTLGEYGAQTGNNSGIYPDSVMKDFVTWGLFQNNNLADTSILRLTGLNPSLKYDLKFFGSNTFGGWSSSNTTYKAGTQTVTLDVQNNTTRTVAIKQLIPDATGTIAITMIGDPDPQKGGFLNAMEIESLYDDGTVPARPTNISGQFVEHKGSLLTWTDVAYNELTYKVFRSSSRSGPYTLLNPGALNNNTTSYIDSTATPLSTFYYYLMASNANGDSPSSDTVSVLIGNNSPVISSLNNIFVKTNSTVNEDFTATDNPGDVVTVSSPNLPAFASLQNLGNANYRIVASPTKDNIGRYDVTIVAADDKGGVATQSIILQVFDKSTRSFFINLGSAGKFGGAPWNDVLGFPYAGRREPNMKDEMGTISPIAINFNDSWSGTFDFGFVTGNNSGVYPDSVLRSGAVASDTGVKRIKFTGLDATKRYNVVFMASANDGLTAMGDYFAPGVTKVSLNGRYNSTQTIQLNRLAPVGDSIIVSLQKQAASTYLFLNAIVLEEFTDTFSTSILLDPTNLRVEPKDRSSVQLTWSDRSNVETGYEVWRATSASGPFALITTTGVNATGYLNTGLTPNTKYYYEVRAVKSPSTYSNYSNVVATITPKNIVYINLTFTYPAGFPWNNTNANPTAGLTFANLISDQNLNTGLALTITQQFNGQNDAGMQTYASGGIFPDNVMRSSYWTDKLQLAQFKVSGLNQSKRYRFGFFGSTGPAWYDGDFTATYSIGSRTVYLNSHRNDSKVVFIGDVVPDGNGEVLLNVSTTSSADYGFTSALVLEEYDDATGGTIPNRIITSGNGTSPGTDQLADQNGKPDLANKLNTGVTGISAYPNPFTDQLNVEFYNTAAGNQVTVDILDISGRLVYRRSEGYVSAGRNKLSLNVENSGLLPGVYLVKLNINGQNISTTKLVKSRK